MEESASREWPCRGFAVGSSAGGRNLFGVSLANTPIRAARVLDGESDRVSPPFLARVPVLLSSLSARARDGQFRRGV